MGNQTGHRGKSQLESVDGGGGGGGFRCKIQYI